jgi:hypothetical protein
MKSKSIAALCAAASVFGAAAGASAAARAVPDVTVRVEGSTRTLLARTAVTTRSGWITKSGIPKDTCPATSAQGALDRATHHAWHASFAARTGKETITAILGETHRGPRVHWRIFVNNRAAGADACTVTLHGGDHLLFAAATRTERPVAIEAPSSVRVGSTFTVEVVSFDTAGRPRPLADATLSVDGRSGTTDSRGTVPLTPKHVGTFVLTAERVGYVRAAPVQLRVTP